MLTRGWMWFAVLILVVGACSRADDDAPGDTMTQRVADTSMADMPGMRSGSGSEQTLAAMETHLRSMEDATAAEMKVRLPLHRPAVANMIAEVDREMRDMNMPADARWNAALDSLRQDLRVMPDLSAESLRAMMPAHSARVRGVIAMHRAMIAKMGH